MTRRLFLKLTAIVPPLLWLLPWSHGQAPRPPRHPTPAPVPTMTPIALSASTRYGAALDYRSLLLYQG